jgi:hypothetical protein
VRTLSLKAMTAALAFTAFPAPAFADNGAPGGSHYNLNIIGVPHDKTADMTGTQGHTIFVALTGKSTIHYRRLT